VCDDNSNGIYTTNVDFFFILKQFGADDTTGVRGAVWFGFESKSHPNRKIKKHAVWFGLVDFKNKIRTKPNQTNAVWFGSVSAVFLRRYNFLFQTLKLS